uniref:Uncharacterized protein n=1 Tax=Arundo donax TaxID=35708 RepID=A0A0A9H5W2_ARUDO
MLCSLGSSCRWMRFSLGRTMVAGCPMGLQL